MPGLDRPQAKVLTAIYLSALAVILVLYHLGVATREPVVVIVLTVASMVCLGVGVSWFFREVARWFGVVCFDDGRCVALDDIALIYARPTDAKEQA
jgi:hypothetical protein